MGQAELVSGRGSYTLLGGLCRVSLGAGGIRAAHPLPWATATSPDPHRRFQTRVEVVTTRDILPVTGKILTPTGSAIEEF